MSRKQPPKLIGVLHGDIPLPTGWQITVWSDDSGATRYVAEKPTSTESEPLKRVEARQLKLVDVHGNEI